MLRHWFDGQVEVKPLGAGHIHGTYLVSDAGERYVLQQVNEYVFKHGDEVMQQTQRVLQCWAGQSQYVVPQLVATRDGEMSCRIGGNLWRVWKYVDDNRVVDPIENEQQIFLAAKAFADFQLQLRHLRGTKLNDSIEGFLQLNHYLEALKHIQTPLPSEYVPLVHSAQTLAHQFEQRNTYIHGDCKVNNVLFNPQATQVLAVIDFDTVMYGHWGWDFGDLVRSVCFSSGGYQDTSFKACVAGFSHLPYVDAQAMSQVPAYVAIMLGIRFLTDHLNGDVYFKVEQAGQNLHRANEQFELYKQFTQAQTEMFDLANMTLKAAQAAQ